MQQSHCVPSGLHSAAYCSSMAGVGNITREGPTLTWAEDIWDIGTCTCTVEVWNAASPKHIGTVLGAEGCTSDLLFGPLSPSMSKDSAWGFSAVQQTTGFFSWVKKTKAEAAHFARCREEKMEWAGTESLCAKSWGWRHATPRLADGDSPASLPASAAATLALSPSSVEAAATWLCTAMGEVSRQEAELLSTACSSTCQ